jgi:choline dehydrogenase-like flavoprotein
MINAQDCILGSGSASAVLALRLARSGRSVVVVEEGRYVQDSFGWTEAEISRDLLRQGGRLPTTDGAVSLVQGRCVGGSATVGMGIAAGPDPGALREWAELGWSTELLDRFGAAADGVMVSSGAAPDPEESRAPVDRLLEQAAAAVGSQGRWLARMPGRPITAVLEQARAEYGAEIRTATRVLQLIREKRRVVRAFCPGAEVIAERFILCTGAVHASILLQRSGLGGGAAGEGLTLTHRVLVLGRLPTAVDHGPAPGAFVLDGRLRATDGEPGYAISPASVGAAFFAAHCRLSAADLGAVLRSWASFVPLWVSVPEPGARVSTDRRKAPRIRRANRPSTLTALRDGMIAASRLLFAAGATEVILPVDGATPWTSTADLAAFRDRDLNAAELPMVCLDPQGGCALGPDGVVDFDFRVHGTDNVYVADASLFPGTVGLHPMVPVMALGELLATELLK